MPLIGLFKGTGPSGFGYNSRAEDVLAKVDLAGKTILVTGVRTGLGFETTRVLGSRGAHVFATARTKEQADAALRSAGAAGTGFACDLSEPASVRACVAEVKKTGRKLDALLCNAGVMALATLQVKHGLEMQFLTNHIGHFLLVTGLLDSLTENGRVVILSSEAHTMAPGIDFDNLDGARGYKPWLFYGQSKLANLLFAKQLAKRLAGTKRTANALHPGVIRTELSRHMNPVTQVLFRVTSPLFFKSAAQGAATQCWAVAHPSPERLSGEYFSDCNVATPAAPGRDAALAEKLWARTEQLVAALP